MFGLVGVYLVGVGVCFVIGFLVGWFGLCSVVWVFFPVCFPLTKIKTILIKWRY